MVISRRAMLQAAPFAGALAAAEDPVVGLATGTYGMKSMEWSAALRTLAGIGYDGVELALMPGWPTDPEKMAGGARRELRMVLQGVGLAVPSMLESLPLLPGKRAGNLERLRRAIDFGNSIDPAAPPVVETVLGLRAEDWDAEKSRMVEELGDWAKMAESSRTTVCFKPHAAHAVNSPGRAVWLAKQVGSPRLRVVYDYSHMFVEGFPLEASLREMFPWIRFIAVKDGKGTAADHTFLLPGDGTTDYGVYFRLLRELRYSGYLGVEVSALIHRQPGYEPVAAARLCYERLAPYFGKAGIRRPRRG